VPEELLGEGLESLFGQPLELLSVHGTS